VARLEAQPATFLLKRDWRRMLWVSAAILAGILLVTPGSWLARGAWAAACIAMLMLLVEAAAWDASRAPRKLKARLDGSARDTYFGDDGIICNGWFFTWLGADVYLTAASVDAREPRSLNMEFEKIVPNPYGSPNIIKVSQGVLIPQDQNPGDLPRLRAALGSRCPTARLSL
jgi:hypothetical protein